MLHQLLRIKHGMKKRVGRGTASGKGKTAGRGYNGQKSRSGCHMYAGFAGGQTRMAKRIPKLKGFSNFNRIQYQVVNLDKLNAFEADTVVTRDELAARGFIKQVNKPVKILGNGKLEQKLTVRADRFSNSAIEKIEKAGGSYEVLADLC